MSMAKSADILNDVISAKNDPLLRLLLLVTEFRQLLANVEVLNIIENIILKMIKCNSKALGTKNNK